MLGRRHAKAWRRPSKPIDRSDLGAASSSVLLAELVDAARGVDDLLLTGVERMAVRADLDLEVMAKCRARLECVAAGAGDGDLFVIRMGGGFHGNAHCKVEGLTASLRRPSSV